MASFFDRNIDDKGRVVRGATGLVLLTAGGFLLSPGSWRRRVGLGLVATGAFALYEAWRGWCLMRACGVKTRL